MTDSNATRYAFRTLASILVWTAGACAGEDSSIRRPAPGQEVSQSRAERATQAGEWHKAAALWNELFLRGGEGRVHACRETARALTELGDHDGARALLELGLRRDPGEPALLESQGDVLVAMGFRRAAEAAYVQALDADPERQHALLELARVRIDLGREHLALAALDKRLELGARDAETHLLRARALAACDRPEEAYQAFVRAFEQGAGDPLCLVSAASLTFDERLRHSPACRDQARAWLERASESNPQLTLAHYYLGVLCEEDDDLDGLHEQRSGDQRTHGLADRARELGEELPQLLAGLLLEDRDSHVCPFAGITSPRSGLRRAARLRST